MHTARTIGRTRWPAPAPSRQIEDAERPDREDTGAIQWLRLNAVCQKYAIDRTTLWRWRKRYRIACRYVGKMAFVSEADVRGVIEGTTPLRDSG